MNHFQETIKELEKELRENEINVEALRKVIAMLQKYVPPPSPTPPATPKKSSSKYLGVSLDKRIGKWQTSGYKDKKVKYLGLFDIEEEAAAVVQEYLGNEKEAQRLRVIAAQKQGKPAEPESGPRSSEGGWGCNKCGRLHKVKLIPVKCENCNNESFLPMTASGKGAYDHAER